MVITALTRNQVVAQAARGFESHPIRQQEPVIKPITGSVLFSETGNSVLLHFFGEKIIHSPQRRSSLHRLVKSSRQTASAAPCQGTAQQFVSLLCGETAEAHHGKCANENLPKSEYGSLLKGCRRYALEIFSPQILIVQLCNLEYAYLNDSPWKTDSVFRCTDCFARSNGIRPPAFPSQCRTAPLQSQWQQGWRGRNLACSSADLQSR